MNWRTGGDFLRSPARDHDALLAALKDMRGKHPGGRPAGRRKGQPWSRPAILEWYDAQTQFDDEPTLAALADAMGLSDRGTARERVAAVELHWPPTPAELDELPD